MSDLTAFQVRLGCKFRDENLLRLALTHPSVAHEGNAPTPHNQRLEFLGDAVLQLVLTRELYEKFPAFDEGPLTKARAKLVNRRTLAEHARALGLGAHLILGHGEEKHGGVELARGSGKSKKAAESDAALAALKTLREQLAEKLREPA